MNPDRSGYLELSASDVESLQGGDGGAFRDFVKRLIRTHMLSLKIPETDFASDAKNMQDGGCDAEVRSESAQDPEHHLDAPTVWQFKATEAKFSDQQLEKEINKAHAKKRILEGYRFVFSIAADMAADKVSEWEEVLNAQRKLINSAAPPVRVYAADRLARWCSRYPGLVLNYRGIDGFQSYETWGKSITQATRVYVPAKAWEGAGGYTKEHLDFGKAPVDACLLIRGAAGVGKSRFVYETIAQIPEIKNLCLYSSSEDAVLSLATAIAGIPEKRAIIVADECQNETRRKLDDILAGHLDRVRVVAMNNVKGSSYQPGPEPELTRLPNETVQEIIEKNFPAVPEEDRRLALQLASGFVKIASDLCRHGISAGIRNLGSYIESRVGKPEHHSALWLLSLFTRVGFKGNEPAIKSQLETVARLCKLDAGQLEASCKRLKDGPGFVGIGGRYFYVTPDAIAQHCLERAWAEWVEGDPKGFYEGLTVELRASFDERIKALGTEKIRREMSAAVESLVAGMEPVDLADKKKANRLLTLVETDPGVFLGRLRRLIEAADDATMAAFSGGSGRTGRRQTVWICEYMAPFREFYYDVEAILFKLAMTETETSISNNATAIWRQVNRIILSGSSVPFLERFSLLQKRFCSGDPKTAHLCLAAVLENLGRNYHRMGTPPVVAGRIPPRDWHPKDAKERHECFLTVQGFLAEARNSDIPGIREAVLGYLVDHVQSLLGFGWLDFLQETLSSEEVLGPNRAKIIEGIEGFLRYSKDKIRLSYRDQIADWRRRLAPASFDDRLKLLVSKRHFWNGDDDTAGRSELKALAAELLSQPELLKRYLPWLNAEAGQVVLELGAELAAIDKSDALFEVVAANTDNLAPVLRGYIFGAIRRAGGAIPPHILRWLDTAVSSTPQIAYHVVVTFPDRLDGAKRALAIARSKAIPPQAVSGLFYGLPDGALQPSLLTEALDLMLQFTGEAEPHALEAALNLADTWFTGVKKAGKPVPPADERKFWNPLVEIIRRSDLEQGVDTYYWSRVARQVLAVDPHLVVQKAFEGFEGDVYAGREVVDLLVEYAKINPKLVIEELGKLLTNPRMAMKLGFQNFGGLLSVLPVEVIVDWVEQSPNVRAKLFAGSLPRPHLDDNGNPTVPDLTIKYLDKFGGIEGISRKFIGGSGIRSYSGDIAGQHRKQAEEARKFLGHSNAIIREWAEIEAQSAQAGADWWQQKTEEENI